MNKLLAVKSILWFFIAFGAVTGILRLIFGLGATTGLSDAAPWGLWIGFDVMAGVALAAGGFVMAGLVYVFHLEKFRPIVRPAVLTAFLGYVIVAIGLMMDLGLPWNIWHPMVFWQYHSVLFEVGTCVMLYLTVLSLEVAPVVLEHPFFSHPFFKKVYKLLKGFSVPLVILGIMLSTLHQSSLGSLFLIMSFRVHELWYSPILYVLYFVSAIGLGCAMIIVESSVSSFLYDHKPKLSLMKRLGQIGSGVLGLYAVIRIGDLLVRGKAGVLFGGSGAAMLFWLEMSISTFVPIILFNLKSIQKSTKGLFFAGGLTVAGFILNRQDIFFTMAQKGPSYTPWFSELMISLALVAGATVIFFFFIENFDLYGEGFEEKDESKTHYKPGKSLVWGVKPADSRMAFISAAIVLGAGAALALLPQSARTGFRYPDTPVRDAVGWDTLTIDGNRAGESVAFPHKAHQNAIGEDPKDCAQCHHMSKTGDGPTSCHECHRDMYLKKSIFQHDAHQAYLGGNASCVVCHPDTKEPAEVISCGTEECHPNMLESDTSSIMAHSYMDAMHRVCADCHHEQAEKTDSLLNLGYQDKADSVKALGTCTSCHPGLPPDEEMP